MLCLNGRAIRKIDQNLIQRAVEKAYRLVLSENYNMPDRQHVADGDNILLQMPCFSEDYFAVKLVSVFPDAKQLGYPAVNGVVVLSDNTTGQPLSIMDGAAVTAQRTGAVGGVAVKFLSPESIETAGVFGAGVQGLSQARYLLVNRKIKTLHVYDVNQSASQEMVSVLGPEFPWVDYQVVDYSEELVEKSEVVIAATTSSTPLFEASPDSIKGKIFISIGSFRPEMQEFPDVVIKTADHVFVDTPFAADESGDIAIPLKKGVVAKEKMESFAVLLEKNRTFENKTVFFKSVGMALFDLTVAGAIYQHAVKKSEKGMGQIIDWQG